MTSNPCGKVRACPILKAPTYGPIRRTMSKAETRSPVSMAQMIFRRIPNKQCILVSAQSEAFVSY